ncbi:helix-turn-helix domain-containing protein [Gemmiger sp. An120]|uniref:helix-turn-helix domain-containing protein n=1 Tax=Gemmiger sp. An120 TaxID=1965549 RepID=UPI001302E389|nr:helix-turn-helix domain-containing protein [Gemmiger sp. An120]
MDKKQYERLCYSLAKALNSAVRLYRGQECCYYYSVYHLNPDPIQPYLSAMLSSDRAAGVYATPLYQFYAYITLEEGWRLILGPSRIQNEDPRLEQELLFLLGVSEEKQEEYRRILRCLPSISAERLGWLISFLSIAINRREPRPEELFINLHVANWETEVAKRHISQSAELQEDDSLDRHRLEYNAERLLLSYIENGEPDKIEELFTAGPVLGGGPMADNTLRQVKNTCICAATLAARAAIAGGMDDAASFRLSDLYIQRVELTQDLPSLEKLRTSIILDFARQVQQVRYPAALAGDEESKSLFHACAEYVSQNLYNQIRVEEMAQQLGYSRSYLCSRFKKLTGLTITQYVLQQKILSAQRMLEFTDKSISEIAALYMFSSQSHFQNVFKCIAGQTPQTFRLQRQARAK